MSAALAATAALVSAATSFRFIVSRSASLRLLANTIVEFLLAINSAIRDSTCGQMDVCCGAPAAEPENSVTG